MITIVDYGMGNLRSVQKAFEFLGIQAEVTQESEKIAKAQKVVMPGVGAFGDCMRNLKQSGLYDAVLEAVNSKRPFLGICLGLQALFEESEEGGRYKGFGAVHGKVVRFTEGLKVPHMGWNRINFTTKLSQACPLLEGISEGSYVYFVHSYYGMAEDKNIVMTQTDYGVKFDSMIWKENIFATQFHPEKSQSVGLKILSNFAKL
jgi:glutamine amidotransferase